MNLYIRYFDNETLVHNVEEALQFLRSLGEITVTRNMETEIREYVASNVMFPKRYKVRAHVYFIMIKTTANTMRDFKEKKAIKPNGGNSGADNPLAKLNMRRDGWYEGTIDFKRVVLIPATGKHEYRDTTYVARCKACSGWIATTVWWIICAHAWTTVASSLPPRARSSISSIWACGRSCHSSRLNA